MEQARRLYEGGRLVDDACRARRRTMPWFEGHRRAPEQPPALRWARWQALPWGLELVCACARSFGGSTWEHASLSALSLQPFLLKVWFPRQPGRQLPRDPGVPRRPVRHGSTGCWFQSGAGHGGGGGGGRCQPGPPPPPPQLPSRLRDLH